MKRKYKQWIASLFCLSLLALGACGGGGNEEFEDDFRFSDTIDEDSQADFGEEDSQEEFGEEETGGQCNDDDWSACDIFAGEVCLNGVCVGSGRGGGSECDYSGGCRPGTFCSNGVCM